jgi:hypothetical protein
MGNLVMLAHQVILIGVLGRQPMMVQMGIFVEGMVSIPSVRLMETVGMLEAISIKVKTVALARHAAADFRVCKC